MPDWWKIVLAIALYASIIHDFADACYYQLRDWQRVVCVASVAFIVLTCIAFPDWRVVGGSALIAIVAVVCALILGSQAE